MFRICRQCAVFAILEIQAGNEKRYENQQHNAKWHACITSPPKEEPIYFAVRFHSLSVLMDSENFKFVLIKIYKDVNFIASAIFHPYKFFIIV